MRPAADINAGVIRSSALISAFSILGLAGGLSLDMLLAARFGLCEQLDALFAALMLPQLSFTVVSGAFQAVLVPAFAHASAHQEGDGPWYLFSSVTTLCLLVIGGLTLLGVIGSHVVIRVMFPGLPAETAELAVGLSRIVFWMLLPSGAIHTISALLNSRRRFAAPAGLNLVQYLVVIGFALLGVSRWGIAAVAAGYAAGACGQFFVLALAFRRLGGRYHPMLGFRDHELRQTVRQLLPLLANSTLGQSTSVVERLLASFLPPGSIAALAYARRILRAVVDVFLSTFSTALLPRYSTLSARGNLEELQRAVGFGLRLVSSVTVPVVSLLAVLRTPIIRVVFQRGVFDAFATRLTADVMALFVVSVPFLGIMQVANNAFYARRDTGTPILLQLLALAVNLALDVALVRVAGLQGLALSLLLARATGAGAALVALRGRLGTPVSALGVHFSKLALAAVALLGSSLFAYSLGVSRMPTGRWWEFIAVCVAGITGVLAYLAVCLVTQLQGLDGALTMLRSGLSRARSSRPQQL